MDPATGLMIASIGSSLLGGLFGGSDQQQRRSFAGAGVADPKLALQDALNAIRGFGGQLSQRGPVQLRSMVPPPAAPIKVPGLDVQIGGGLGVDPANFNQALTQFPLFGQGQGGQMQSPFEKLAAGNITPGARMRSPNAQSTGHMAKPRTE